MDARHALDLANFLDQVDTHLPALERLLGRKLARHYLGSAQWKAAYAAQPPGALKYILAIGVAATECPEGMPLWANWNALHLPHFKGTPLEELFPGYAYGRTQWLAEQAQGESAGRFSQQLLSMPLAGRRIAPTRAC